MSPLDKISPILIFLIFTSPFLVLIIVFSSKQKGQGGLGFPGGSGIPLLVISIMCFVHPAIIARGIDINKKNAVATIAMGHVKGIIHKAIIDATPITRAIITNVKKLPIQDLRVRYILNIT